MEIFLLNFWRPYSEESGLRARGNFTMLKVSESYPTVFERISFKNYRMFGCVFVVRISSDYWENGTVGSNVFSSVSGACDAACVREYKQKDCS